MNYLKNYIKLIKKAKNRELPEGTYVEKHHVFPVSIFGRKGNNTLVKLTYKEHLVAHHLLYKACLKRYGENHYRTIKTAHALICMTNLVGRGNDFSAIRTANYIKKADKIIKCNTGENNSMYGKTGENNPNYGSKRSEGSKKLMSEKKKGKYDGENNPMWGKRGEKSPNYGKARSEKTKKKISESQSREKSYMWGKRLDEETRKKMSESQKGEKNHMWGKTHTEETREIISEKVKKKTSGENNPRYDSRLYLWENIQTGEKECCTNYELTSNYDVHSGAIAGVKYGKLIHAKGWIFLGEAQISHQRGL